LNSPSARTRRLLAFGPALAVLALAAGCSAASTSSAAAPSAPSSGPAGTTAPATSSAPATTTAPATGSSTPSGTSNPAAAGSGCSSQDLRAGAGTSEGAAGSVYQVITFTNVGGTPCTLQGYPGVSLAGGSPLAQVGAAADRQSGETATVVTLQPQGVASATLRIVDAQNFPSAKCGTEPTTAIKIYPPNQTAPLYLSYKSTGCTVSATHLLTITTVVSGSGGGQ
jgi:Domain of unknown function (DUF4232)